MDLTEKQWNIVSKFIPLDPVRPDGRGRPWTDRRTTLNGVLWVLRTGAPWKDLPGRYGAHTTVHRRFQAWRKAGVIEQMLRALALDLERRGKIDLREGFIDGSFSAAKKGALALVKPSVARAPRSWQLSTQMVFLSPSTQKLLRPPKSGSSLRRSKPG